MNSVSPAAAETRAQTRSAAPETAAGSIFWLRMSAVTLSRICSSLLLFIVFLQIVPNLFSQFRTCAMEDNANHQRRGIQKCCDLLVVKPLVITQNKHLTGGLAESRNGLTNECL